MSPADAEPELIQPAEHICYLHLTLRFCLVNILVAISALLIFIMWPVSFGRIGGTGTRCICNGKKWINLTNVDDFSSVDDQCRLEELAFTRWNLLSWWSLDWNLRDLWIKGMGMTSLIFSCPRCIYSMTTYKYTHARTQRSPSSSRPSCSVARWRQELFYTAGKWAWQSTLIFHPG